MSAKKIEQVQQPKFKVGDIIIWNERYERRVNNWNKTNPQIRITGVDKKLLITGILNPPYRGFNKYGYKYSRWDEFLNEWIPYSHGFCERVEDQYRLDFFYGF